jgi:hypothetical protein
MVDQSSKSVDAHHDDLKVQVTEPARQPFLRVKPRSFFSNKFDLEIVEDHSKDDGEDRKIHDSYWLSRLIDINILLLIVFVGVPVLVYCIVASAS